MIVRGNNWLRTAALALPQERVVMDESAKVLTGEKDVIGYAGWGSNDPNRHQRNLGLSMAARRAGHRICFDRRPHLPAAARRLDHRHLEGCGRLVRRARRKR